MPPRTVRKTSGASSGAVKRAGARTTRGRPAGGPTETEKTAQEEAVVKTTEVTPPEPELVPDANGSVEEEDTKEVYAEEDKGERLDLDDTELEYDPEEEPIMEYDGKDLENEDELAEGDAGEEDVEEDGHGGGIRETDEADMIEEIESDGEDVEGEEDDEDAEEEQNDVVEDEEHHEVVTDRRKRKEFEVFVGGLDKDASEEDLKKVFSEVGQVVEVRLMKNPLTKKNKGFAFLRFATVEQAKRAVAELKNPVLLMDDFHTLVFRSMETMWRFPSQDNDTLFLGNICKTWTKEDLKAKLKHYGVDNVEDLTLVEDSNNEGNNRGFAFLEFASRKDAMDAYRCLRRRDVVFGVDRIAKVSFADSFIEPDDEIMAQVKTVFVDGLPVAWDEERLRDYLKKFGHIEKVELARNMPSAKRRDFGFVTFDTHDSAVKCAESINNTELGEGDKKVKVRARLSRPLQKGRGKFGRRVEFLRTERTVSRGGRFSWSRPLPYRMVDHSSRPVGGRAPIGVRGVQRPTDFKSRRPIMGTAERIRQLPPQGVPMIEGHQVKFVSLRSRAPVEYATRDPAERRSSYRDAYDLHGPAYADDAPRSASRTTAVRRSYDDEGYGRRLERPLSVYREGHGRDYDSISGSKRPYAAIDDTPPRYGDVSSRQSRPRFDYGVSSSSEYDSYGERLSRSHAGYGSNRSSLSGQESHSAYSSSRYGMNYSGVCSARSGDVGGMHSSSYGDNSYVSRSQVIFSILYLYQYRRGSSYSSLYSSRGMGGGGYLGGSGSGSYY
ncbi:unnamed protein product [Spirodela intermedia]|uniref:RRM domain-containing protein n=1 Tax=Spirodela intermedia TaxID=51605 RepID=A0A7I8JHZ0_SPIIN|nr:unnamed protein product [Spirodela intermedia]CAA6669774.1 unnamed protein product [Spirodela intermedia]